VAAAVEYGLYQRFLQAPLRTRDLAQMRLAVTRWVKFTVVWQLVVLGGIVLYLAAFAPGHGHGVAWVAPPVGATLGTALPLQFVVMAIVRSSRQ
jgi:hypothetical protein